jgi:hypothetical protein
MQDVECCQPHTRKVAIIDPGDAPEPTSAPTDPLAGMAAGRHAMQEALRRSASVLKAAGVPFALAGSYALWVYGAPESTHDVDLAVAESSTEQAADALAAGGFAIERPPEDWLFKASRDGVLVDVLHRLVGEPITVDRLSLAEEHDVLGVRMPVLVPTEVMITKLLSLSEQYCDFGALLPHARAVRELIDWPRMRAATADHPYAEAFVHLLDNLGVSGLPIRSPAG